VWRLACPKSPHDLIFPNLDGRPMSYWNLMARGFHPALTRAGIRRIRFHDLNSSTAAQQTADQTLEPPFRMPQESQAVPSVPGIDGPPHAFLARSMVLGGRVEMAPAAL
jgi:hypothetical protein